MAARLARRECLIPGAGYRPGMRGEFGLVSLPWQQHTWRDIFLHHDFNGSLRALPPSLCGPKNAVSYL